MNHLQRAVEIVGSQKKLADTIGSAQQHISLWLSKRNPRPPPKWAIPIEKATGGMVTRHQLRPDLYPDDGPEKQ